MVRSIVTRLGIGLAALAGLACGADKSNAPTPPGPLASITIVASAPSAAPGQTVGLVAVLRDEHGLAILNGVVLWSSSDAEVGTVSATGEQSATVQALRPGSVEITATNGSHTGRISLRFDGPLPQEPPAAVMWSADGVITSLGTLAGGGSSFATSINDAGQIVGTSTVGVITHGFLWTPGQGMVDIGTLPGFLHTYPAAVNNAGQVVGVVSDGNGASRPFLWSAATGMVAITSLPGAAYTQPAGINDGGVVVGIVELSTAQRGFRWTAAGGMQALAPLPGDLNSEAYAVNASGTIVGQSNDGQYYGTTQAAQWDAAGAVTLIPACVIARSCNAFAQAISPNGQVAGSRNEQAGLRGFHWTAAGGITDVGFLPARTYSYASGINDLGQIVGTSGPDDRAFLWTRTAGMKNLGVLPGKYQSYAVAINKNGQIAGTSQ